MQLLLNQLPIKGNHIVVNMAVKYVLNTVHALYMYITNGRLIRKGQTGKKVNKLNREKDKLGSQERNKEGRSKLLYHRISQIA